MNFVLPYFKLLRPLNLFLASLSIFLGSAILGAYDELDTLVPLICVVLFYTGAANSLNDFIDYKIDLINCPNRPIPSGDVSKNTALIFSIILFIFGSISSIPLDEKARLICLGIAMPLMILYNLLLKGLPLIGNVVVALIISMTFLFCGAAFNKMGDMIVPACLSFGLTLVREIVKDLADIDGDKALGMKTLPIVIGIKTTIRLLIFFIICTSIGIFIPFLYGFYNSLYGIIIFFGVEIPLGVTTVNLIVKPGIQSAKNAAKLLKFSTMIGIFAIYFGTLN